jgi:hypothetical protein
VKLWQLQYPNPSKIEVTHRSVVFWAPTERAARDERKRLIGLWAMKSRDFTIQPAEIPTTEGREALCKWLNERDVESR